MVDTGRGWHTGCQFCYTGTDHPVEYADHEEFEEYAGGSSIVKSYDDTTAEGTPEGEVTVSFTVQETGVDVLKHCDGWAGYYHVLPVTIPTAQQLSMLKLRSSSCAWPDVLTVTVPSSTSGWSDRTGVSL